MARAYSLDLREKIINYIKNGGSKREASRIFSIGEDSVYRWIRLHNSGNLKPKKRVFFKSKVDPIQLQQYLQENPDHTLEEIGKALNLGRQTVWTWLNRLKITRKKKQRNMRNRA